jgi:outer membrane protein assembly factor BamA
LTTGFRQAGGAQTYCVCLSALAILPNRYYLLGMRILACLARAALIGALLLAPRAAFSIGEVIRDIRVRDNARTDDDTIRSLAGVSVGDTMELHTLETVRERLNTSGLFADVNVYWEPYRDGVRINIVIRDKFPWAPVPTFSYTAGNISAGLVVVHGNLFGRGKRGVIGGRISTADSGAILAYQDPSVFGSPVFYQFSGALQDQTIPEFPNVRLLPENQVAAVRESSLRTFGLTARLGLVWFRRVRTAIGWTIDKTRVRWTRGNEELYPGASGLLAPTKGGVRGVAMGELTFDFRAREHAVMWGPALSFGYDQGAPRWGGDEQFRYWKARASFEQGFRFFRTHNIILRAGGYVGRNLPLWAENSVGGANLRGYLHHQFAGDTQGNGQLEYHFPLVSVLKLDIRGLVFSDAAAIYYSKLPPVENGDYLERRDGRRFLPPGYLVPGFDRKRDVHLGVGAGLRFFLRAIAVPLVGVDFGYGIDDKAIRMVLVVGA